VNACREMVHDARAACVTGQSSRTAVGDAWSVHSADRSKRATSLFLGGFKARGGTRWYGGYLRSAASWAVYGICTTCGEQTELKD
jgi:hypothetical protein